VSDGEEDRARAFADLVGERDKRLAGALRAIAGTLDPEEADLVGLLRRAVACIPAGDVYAGEAAMIFLGPRAAHLVRVQAGGVLPPGVSELPTDLRSANP
jgi:hypothetical protein